MLKRIESLTENVSDFIENHYNLMVCIVLIIYFMRSFTLGLLKGGRWDLYQNIAMADRFLSGKGLYYSAVEASSPYFPGVAFLSILIGKLFTSWRDYILLLIASLIGTAFLYALIKLGEKFSKNSYLSLLTIFLLLSMGFESYRSYMNEFKADSLVLLIGILLIWIIDQVEQRKKRVGVKVAMQLFCLGFIMDISKQQALYVDIALGGYLLFTKSLVRKEKIVLLGSLIVAGILDIIIIFNIPGAEILTIKNLSNMPYWSVKTIVPKTVVDFLDDIIYFLFLFLFIYLFIKKKVKLESLGRKWLIIAIVFGGGQMVGAWKIGGNTGNYQAAMVSFLPFLVIAVDYFYKEYFKDEKKRIIIYVLNCAICVMCFGVLAYVGYKSKSILNKINTDREVSIYLSENFGSETLMYHSDNYMQIARSTVNPGMDVCTVPDNINNYIHIREKYLKDHTYKYLYIDPEELKKWDESAKMYFGEEVDAYGMLDKYYLEIKDPDMPESLKGRLFVAK